MGSSNSSQYGITELVEKQKRSDLINELARTLHLLPLLHLTLPQSLGPVEGAAESELHGWRGSFSRGRRRRGGS